MTLPAMPNVTSLQDSAAGPTPLTLPDGRVTDPCGLALALASLSARQVKALGLTTSGIYWPAWQHLIAQCQPASVFGEQVAGKTAEPWLDLVHADMEGLGYAFGCVAFPAASIGAPFAGDRLYWVARASTKWNEQPRKEPCRRATRRVGRQQQPVPWDTAWPDSLARLRALDDGLPRNVAGTDAARNAIVPQQAAEFVMAYLDRAEPLALEAAA